MPTLYDNFSQVKQYIDQEIPDLTSYVTKTELAACSYVTKDELSAQSYLTAVPNTYPTYAAIESMGYMTQAASYAYLSIENLRTNNGRPVQLRATGLQFISSNYTIAPREISYEYINTSTYNNAWIGNTTLKNYVNGRLAEIEGSYVTSSDLNNYLPITGGNLQGNLIPSQSASYNLGSSSSRWKEVRSKFVYTDTAYLQDTSYSSSIVPKETNTYTLGDSSHIYSTSYITDMWLNSTNKFSNRGNSQINLMLNNAWRYVFHANNFSPANDNAINLGESSVRWRSTYTTNLYADNLYTYSLTKIYSTSNYNISFNLNGTNRFQMDTIAFFPSSNNTRNLGTSALKWAATYTTNLYADNIHNFIWQGTSVEYASLSDYTTYQLYLIKNE